MGSAFSVKSYCKSKPVPEEWGGKPEEYEALKAMIYERMGNSDELYQLLLGLKKALSGSNSKYIPEFIDYGYVDLMLDVINKKYLNSDVVHIACMDLIHLAEEGKNTPLIVHSCKALKVLSDLLPKLLQENSIFAVTACLRYLSIEYRGEGDVDIEVLYQRLFKLLHKYEDNSGIRTNIVMAMGGFMCNGADYSLPKFVALNGAEKVCNLFSKYNNVSTVLNECSWVFFMMRYSREGVRDVLQMGGLELIVSAIRASNNLMSIDTGLVAITAMCFGDSSASARALNLGVLDVLRHLLDTTGADKAFTKTIAFCLEALFCFDATFKSQWHADAAALMDEICCKFPNSKKIKKSASTFNRVEDPEARKCREANKCTRAGIGDCIKHPGSQQCKKCYVPQFFFRCSTCEGAYNKVFCLACKERCHKGHKGETFFTIGRCDCENEYCLHPPDGV